MKNFRQFINDHPFYAVNILTLMYSFVIPTPFKWFLNGMIWGYVLYATIDLYALKKMWKRSLRRMDRERMVIEKIFDANKDDLYKYKVLHFIDEAKRN